MIRVSRSSVGPLEEAAVTAVVREGFFGTGPVTQAFEQELGAYLHRENQVACVATGTAALQLAVQGCGIGPGDEVLVPSLTFVACFQAIAATGATPIACDVRLADALIDLEDAKRRVTPRTKAVMFVHYASFGGGLDAVYAFAKERRLRVIEDAAHAFGTQANGQLVGATGDVVCFSFDGIKNITSGEGGAVVTSDLSVLSSIQDARLLGVVRDTDQRYQRQRSWDFEVVEQGWRYHMSDLMAAIGRVQLSRFESDLKPKRVRHALRYRNALRDVPGIALLETAPGVVPHILPIRVLGGRRDIVRAMLTAEGVQTGIHYKPAHLLSRFSGGEPRPTAELIFAEVLSLPLHPDLSDGEIDQITNIVVRGGANE